MASGATIAQAYVQLIPSAQGISSGISSALSQTQPAAQSAANGIMSKLTGAFNVVKSSMLALPFVGITTQAVKLGQEFDASMSNVYSLMSSAHDGAGLTEQEMERLRQTARDMGAQTQFSAKEAADAFGYMALAGWDVDKSIENIPAVLNLAASADMALGTASDIVTDYLSAFSNSAMSAGKMVDMLAFAQANSNTTVEGLAEAYRNCAANMNSAGQSAYTTTAMLEAMANQGYKGSEAGTALSAMMRDLTKNMKKGSVTINKHKIAIQDENGDYRDMIDIMMDVEAATAGMGDAQKAAALKNVFTADSIKGVNLLLNEGMETISGYERALEKSDGAAERMAEILNDNLAGDLKKASSAFDELRLTISDLFMPIVRAVVQTITDLLGKFNSLSPTVKRVIVVVAGLVSILGPLKTLMPIIKGALAAMHAPLLLIAAGFVYLATKTKWFQNILSKVKTLCSNFFTVLDNGGSPLEALKTAVTNTFGADVWEPISGVIDKVTGAVNLMKDALTNGVTAVSDFLTALMNGDGLDAAWTALTSKLSEFDWAGTGAKIWEFLKNGFTSAVGAAGEWIKQATLGEGYTDASTWADVGSKIWENIKSGFSAAVGALGAWIADLLGLESFTPGEAVTAIGENIWNFIKNGFSAAVGAAGSWITSLLGLDGFTPPESVTAVGTNVASAIKGGIDGILDAGGQFLSSGFTAASSAIEKIDWGAASSVITGAFDVLGAAYDAEGKFLSAGFEAARSAISGIDWNGVGSVITGGLSAAISALASIGSSVWDTITGWFSGNGGDSPENTGKEFIGGVTDGMESSNGELNSTASALGDAVVNGLKEKFTPLAGSEAIKPMIDSVRLELQNADMTQSTGTITSTVSTTIKNFNWAEVGKSIITGISNGVKNSKDTLKNAVKSAISGAKSGVVNSDDWKGVGKDIDNGIASGVKNNSSVISNAVTSAINQALAAAQRAAQIGSPSKLFAREVGKWIPAGIGKGIADSTDLATEPLVSMLDSMTSARSAMSWRAGELAATGTTGGGFTQNITVNSPRELSPYEIARQTRNATRNMALAFAR